ncbi:MAG: nucleotidyltransferase domain-containing protein [Armatimonadota bacterium]
MAVTSGLDLRVHQERWLAAAERYDLDLVVVFGSAVRGLTHPDSDVDIAVRTRAWPRDLDWWYGLMGALSAAVGRDSVDVVLLNDASPLLMVNVADEGIAQYERKPDEFLRFQSYARRRHEDNWTRTRPSSRARATSTTCY